MVGRRLVRDEFFLNVDEVLVRGSFALIFIRNGRYYGIFSIFKDNFLKFIKISVGNKVTESPLNEREFIEFFVVYLIYYLLREYLFVGLNGVVFGEVFDGIYS